MTSLPKDEFQAFKDGQLTLEVFDLIRKEYRDRFGYIVVYADLEGNLVYGLPNCEKFPCEESCRLARRQSIEMGMDYGSPLPTRCPSASYFWALPVCLNNEILGGLVVVGVPAPPHWLSENNSGRMERAQYGLMEIAERYNIVNAALLQQKRHYSRRASRAFRRATTPNIPDLQVLWHTQSGPYFKAIKNNNRKAAFEQLEKVLHVLILADSRALSEAKGFALELIASTVGIASNGRQEKKLYFQFHYEAAEQIVLCKKLEEICQVTREGLARFLNVTERPPRKATSQTVQKALAYIEKNLETPLRRSMVAKRVGISPSRLSHLIKEETGESFSGILRRYRMELAREILITTDKSISTIALQSGYCDQSHFTKVFQKYYGSAPMDYRRKYFIKK